MSNQTKTNYRLFFRLGAVVIGVAALIVLVVPSRPTTPKRITITMDTNGTARLGGVPLLTTNIRDGTFVVMGALGVKAGLAFPSPLTNPVQESNLFETLKSMTRAGLFDTNPPPNPYE